MNSNMVIPKIFDYLNLVYNFKIPLRAGAVLFYFHFYLKTDFI